VDPSKGVWYVKKTPENKWLNHIKLKVLPSPVNLGSSWVHILSMQADVYMEWNVIAVCIMMVYVD